MMQLGRSLDRAGRLRLVGPQHADLRRVGRHGAASTRFDQVEYISLHTYLNNYDQRHAGLPGQRRPDGQLHRRGGGDRRCGRGAAALAQAHHAELRRMERLVPHAPQPRGRASSRAGRSRRRSSRRSTTWRMRWRSAACCISLLNHADRVKARVPRPAGQRDRADHDRDRRPGLAADDLLAVRAVQPHGPRPRAAHRGRARRPIRRATTTRRGRSTTTTTSRPRPISSSRRCMTTRRARSPCSR